MFGMPEDKLEMARNAATSVTGLRQDFAQVWRSLPARAPLLVLVAAWTLLFHFLGNSTLGYVNNSSLFGWWTWTVSRGIVAEDGFHLSNLFGSDEAHVFLMPLIVVALLWWRRQEAISLPKQTWWPALGLLLIAVLVHAIGYMVQQARVSMVGFFLGLYALSGLFWGSGWLRLALFPFGLFMFCVPLGTGGVEIVTFPLRLLATKITGIVCHAALGIDVIQDGTLLFDSGHTYQYEVAAACSGIRSLTAILALGVIYGYITFKSTWRRMVVAAMAFPLAVVANVFRLTLIIVAAEAFGRKAGNFVHENSLFSLAPYIPAIGGMLLLGWWLRENKTHRLPEEPLVVDAVEQKL